ncbi:MAG TPA: GAF domain-containing protein [Candidatus Ozemobacteraceae bacterium]|nr:GAF domain-containing protein [Candidatus Ozemobacteraceae bacterium]
MSAGTSSVGLDLKYRIFIFNIALVFAVLAIATWFELNRLNDAAGDHVSRESQRLSKTLEGILPRMIMTHDTGGLNDLAKKITSPELPGNEIVSVAILDKQLQEIAFADQGWRERHDGSLKLPPTFIVQKPIKTPGQQEAVGYLRFTFSMADLERSRSAVVFDNLVLALLMALVAFFWAWYLSSLIVRPVKVLLDAAERISAGDLTGARIDVGGDSELVALVTAFNRMSETIGLHLEDLRQKNGALDRRVFELSTLHQAARAINSVLNLDQLYERIVDTAISILGGVKRCSLMLIDRRTNEFMVRVAKGLDVGLLPPTRRVPIGDGVAARVCISGEPVIINDVPEGDSRKLEVARIPRSSLCVPLKIGDEVVGVLSASNKISGEPFTSDDQALLETLATQSGIAIKNGRFYQDLNRKILELNTLHDIGRNLSVVLDIQRLLEMVVDQTSRVLGGVRSISLILYDEMTGKLHVRVHRGLSPEYAVRPIEIGDGIAGKVFAKCEPLMINDLPSDTPQDSSAPSGRSSLCVPLIVKEHAIGVLSVSEKLSGEIFDDNDLSLLVTLASQISIALHNAKLYEDLEASYLSAVRALANSLDAKDAYTRGHSERVAAFSVEIGRRMGLKPEAIKNLQIGALLHDIGKIGISENIINKPARLTPDEYELIKTHPVRGANIIEPASFLKEKVPLIKHHHERFDGKGYPDGLSGDAIPLLARIVCVADSWDAMTSKRAYRNVVPKEQAVQELLKCAGTQFDPKIVAAFIEVLQDEKTVESILGLGYS